MNRSPNKANRVSDLTSHTGFWLRRVSNHVSHTFSRKLGASGVTVAEWVVLREMYRTNETTSPSTIAETTGLTRGAISKLVSRLLEKGLVHRTEASGDRRYQDIKLTPRAKTLVPKLAAIADENDESFFEKLAVSERKQLRAILMKLTDIHDLTTLPIE